MSEAEQLGVPSPVVPKSSAADAICPRCAHSARYRMCAHCRLRLFCDACGVRLSDPVSQVACDMCLQPVRQLPWGEDEPQGIDEPVPTEARELAAPAEAPVAHLIQPYTHPGDARRHAAGFAAALIAERRYADADEMTVRAIEEPGTTPSHSELILLRAHCARLVGDPGTAIRYSLEAIAEDPGCLLRVAPQIHALLAVTDAHAARLYLLGDWLSELSPADDPATTAAVAALEFHASILEHDQKRAERVYSQAVAVAGEAGAAACRLLLQQIRVRAPADAHLFEVLGRVEAHVDLRREAITDVERAIDLGLADAGAEIALLEFKAGLFDIQTEGEEAAEAFRVAGERAYFVGSYDRAVDLLTRSVSIVDHSDARWHLADALRLQSQSGEAPEERREMLRRARSEWDFGAAAPAADAGSAWALQILAHVCSAQAAAEPWNGRAALEESVLALERRILLDGGDQETWRMLATGYANRELYAVAHDAAQRALQLDETSVDSQLVLGWAQLGVGDPEGADTMARAADEPVLEIEERGLVLLMAGRAEQAVETLKSNLGDSADSPGARRTLASALLDLGREAEAKEHLDDLWRLVGTDGDPEELDGLDWAEIAYSTGRYAEAMPRLTGLRKTLDRSTYSPTMVIGLQALTQLATGDGDAAYRTITEARSQFVNAFDVDEVRRCAVRLGEDPPPGIGKDVIERLVAELDAIGASIRQGTLDLDAAIASLRSEQATGAKGNWRSAVALGLSRLMQAADRPSDLAEQCLRQLADHDIVGRAERDALIDRLLQATDQMFRERDGGGPPLLERAMSVLGSDEPLAKAGVQARLAFELLTTADAERVRRAAEGALPLGADGLADVLRGLGPDPQRLRDLSQASRKIGVPLFDAAFAQLFDELFQLNVDPDDAPWPMATPIVLEIANDLIPDDTSPEGPLFDEYLPQMRTRIERDLGVRVPGVRVRNEDWLAPSTFRISIGEGLPTTYSVQPGRVFVHRSADEVDAALPGDVDTLAATDPVTGKEATWVVPPAHSQPDVEPVATGPLTAAWRTIRAGAHDMSLKRRWRRLVEESGAWEEPIAYPLRVLEASLMRKPATFLTVDEALWRVDQWRSDGLLGDDRPLDPTEVTRLTTLFRDILAEGGRLKAGSSVAGLLAALDPGLDHPAALQACRAALEPAGVEQ
jgi:tetratricopeptide (TPR) repeat protein